MSQVVVRPRINHWQRPSLVRGGGPGSNGTAYYRRVAERAAAKDCLLCGRPRNIDPVRGGCRCIATSTVFAEDEQRIRELNAAVRRGIVAFGRRMERSRALGWVVFALMIVAFALAMANIDRIGAWLGL